MICILICMQMLRLISNRLAISCQINIGHQLLLVLIPTAATLTPLAYTRYSYAIVVVACSPFMNVRVDNDYCNYIATAEFL